MSKRILDISNYEEWVIDHLDGVLTSMEEEMLEAFLQKHPELDVDVSGVQLTSVDSPFPDKESLKMPEDDEFNLIQALEESKEVSSISSNLRSDYLLYQKTILQPDERIVYPDKPALKRSTGRIVPLWVQRVAVAASLIGIVMVTWFGNQAEEYSPRGRTAEIPSFETDELPIQHAGPGSMSPDNLAKSAEDISPSADSDMESDLQALEQSPSDVKPNDVPRPIMEIPGPDEFAQEPKVPLMPNDSAQGLPIDYPLPEPFDIAHNIPDEPAIPELDESVTAQKTVGGSRSTGNSQEYSTALDVLKRATRDSEVLAFENVENNAAYVESTVKVGNFKLAVKRKRRRG